MMFDRRTQVAHGVGARASRRRSRSDLILHAAAVVVGSTIGGGLALRGDPASSPASPAGSQHTPPPGGPSPPSSRSPAAGSAAASPERPAGAPSAHAASTAADPHLALVAQIEDALSRFIAWSHDHLGAPCPDPAALGASALDPWGHPLRIVCADQPVDQIAGVLSLGPDGLPGTRDDVVSWALGAGVTDLVRGPRWSSAWGSAGAATRRRTPPAAKPAASAGAGSRNTDGDGIPDRR